MHDGDALLAAIIAEPDEDTPRLMYADWLDAQDSVSVPCDWCEGRGRVRDGNPDDSQTKWRECPTCKGTRFVPDTSNRDRAELIRVQVELAKFSPDDWQAKYAAGTLEPNHPIMKRQERGGGLSMEMLDRLDEYNAMLDHLRSREKQLLTANADRWRRGPKCKVCGGCKEINAGSVIDKELGWERPKLFTCRACFGTGGAGGLMRKIGAGEVDITAGRLAGGWLHEVTYHRGMLRVHARAADVWGQGTEDDGALFPTGDQRIRVYTGKWQPTAWALAVCRHHPDCCELWVTDQEPESWAKNQTSPTLHLWYFGTARNRQTIPEVIYDHLTDWCFVGDGFKGYPTAGAARVALARTVARWVRATAASAPPNSAPPERVAAKFAV